MVCKKCGTYISEGTGVCPNCGEPAESGFKKFIVSHKVLLITGAVVMAALLLLLCNLKGTANFLRRTFSSPEDYYHYVEKKKAEELSEDIGELYSRYFLDSLDVSDRSVTTELSMTLGEGGRELMDLAGLAGVDLSWFESEAFRMDFSARRDAMAMGLGFVLNEVDILSGNLVLDLDEEIVYLQVPEVNERYMAIEIPDGSLGDMEEVWEMYDMLARICPDREEMEQLTNRYLMTAIECMDDVSREKKILKVGDIEQKCTLLTVTADANTLKGMALELLRQMRDDKDIERIIKEAMGEEVFIEEFYLDDMSPEEAYAEFQDWADREIEALEDRDDLDVYDDETLRMKVYVDDKGEIVGRIVEMGDVTINMLMPEKGEQFGYALSYVDSYFADPDYDESIVLTGTGRRNGDKIDGEFVLEYCDTSIMDIAVKDLHVEDMRKGMPNGSMTLELSEGIEDLMGYTPGMSMVQGMEFTLDFKSDNNSGSCDMSVFMRERHIMDIGMSYKREKGYQGPDPGKNAVAVKDMDDLKKWGRHFDLGGVTDALKEANVPSEVTDSMEMFDGMDLETIMDMMYYLY